MSESSILTEVQAEKDNLITLRRYFHQYPEASLKEVATSQVIIERLAALNIPTERIGATGVLGVIKGAAAGKTLFLRADIDALEIPDQTGTSYRSKHPGLSHACGHDGHIAALLTAAKILQQHRSEFNGTIKLAFQPAEEIGAGAKQFVKAGVLADVDQVFGLHLDSSIPVGKLVATAGATNASCDIFTIELVGATSHVGLPQKGRDALVCGAQLVTELQTIVAREIDPLDPVVIGIGEFHAGTRYNIVANQAKIKGTLRTFDPSTRAFALKRIKEIGQQVAAAHRIEFQLTNYDAAAPVINELHASQLAQRSAAKLVGAANVVTNYRKSMMADDFADFLAVAPGIYGRVGTRDAHDPATQHEHHHEAFNIAEDALVLAAAYHVQVALDYFKS